MELVKCNLSKALVLITMILITGMSIGVGIYNPLPEKFQSIGKKRKQPNSVS
ncbi:MAG: hypothetical protein ACTSWX_14790 [Promethearchaeota archaeon]